MNDIFQSLWTYLTDNWPELLWIVAAAGIASYLAGRKSRARWRKREFLDRLNVSLTSIVEGQLMIRTILEMDVEEVFLNASAAKSLVGFAKRTTAEDPIIRIPKDDCWYYLNSVLNEISERFAEGHLKRDLGIPVTRDVFLLCLTCERAGHVRTQKIRAMLVRKSLLENLPTEEPKYERPLHSTRWETIQILAGDYQRNPHCFLPVELCF